MKKGKLLFFVILIFPKFFNAQQTAVYTDPLSKFHDAKEYFQKEQYSLAYPLFLELWNEMQETRKVNLPVTVQEIEYYTLVCGLKKNESLAEQQALKFVTSRKNTPRTQMMHFHLGEYYFRQEKFPEAVRHYEETHMANLSNREIADMKFHQGYSYFVLQRFEKAKPLFQAIKSIPNDPNYVDANYYYGWLAYRDRQYQEAFNAFQIAEKDNKYSALVPYYIAQIYYLQGKKEQAISYVENILRSGGAKQYYEPELKQLLGHAYFEKKEFSRALPYLEDYIHVAEKVRREDLYELAYCYYILKNYTKAIEGFKQLSGGQDSLSQHAMYLLGDAYLKTGQKANARNAFLFCATNSSNSVQKEISSFLYAKLSYELGFQDEALNSLSQFISAYPASSYRNEAQEIMIHLLAGTNNYKDAMAMIEGLSGPSENIRRIYPKILFGRAAELMNDGRLREADALLSQILSLPYNRQVLPLVYFWKGEIGYRFHQLDTAIRYFHAYLDAGAPTAGEAAPLQARYNLGYAYLRKENYKLSLSYFEPLVKTPAQNSDLLSQDIYMRTADNYYMLRNFDKAKSMYEAALRFSWPSEDYALLQLAMIAGIKNANEKIQILNQLIRKFPQSPHFPDAHMEIAKTYMANEKYREAIPYLKTIIGYEQNTAFIPQAYLKLGTAYYNLDNNQEALTYFKTLAENFPNAPEAEDAIENIKNIYIETGKPDEYSAFMRKIGKPLSRNTEDEMAWAAAQKLHDDQKLREALQAYQQYLQKFPDGAHITEAYFNIAEIYYGQKDWANALPSYEKVVSLAPNAFAERSALIAARLSFFEFKDYQKAEFFFKELKRFAGTQENRLEAMRGLLRCQYHLKKWEEGATNARELSETKGSTADDKALANLVLAKSHQSAARYQEAIGHYRSVVQLNKSALAAEARYETAYCLFQLNRLNEAEKAAFETINKSGSYDFWIGKAYLLLGDIFFKQKDYFNAKATYQSVAENAAYEELRKEASAKLNAVKEEEAKSGKINQ
ncbi:MAG: tetratricopeptide repeat protein [Chitinophagaceae bacterium]|nr:tetratricopeptide repeat protein [Chitinophagaceae bacterium]